MTDATLRQQVADVLSAHKGRENAISSKQIMHELGIDDAEARPNTRKLVREVIREYNLPVASTSDGYFVIDDADELEAELGSLDGRIEQIEERKRLIVAAWNKDTVEQEVLQ